MDHNSIIDRKTYDVYEHSEDYPYAFICDKLIASSVALLNKKGYETFASCSGHYKSEFYEWFDEDILNLEEYNNNQNIIITEIRKNSFDYMSMVDGTTTYILFSKKYEFDTMPEGFNINDANDDDRTCIESRINYYDENNKRKKRCIVEKEIEQRCNILKEWVNKLPYNERND